MALGGAIPMPGMPGKGRLSRAVSEAAAPDMEFVRCRGPPRRPLPLARPEIAPFAHAQATLQRTGGAKSRRPTVARRVFRLDEDEAL